MHLYPLCFCFSLLSVHSAVPLISNAIFKVQIVVHHYVTHTSHMTVRLEWSQNLGKFLCCMQSKVAHRDHFVRLSACLSDSHTFLVVICSYVSQATGDIPQNAPLCFLLWAILLPNGMYISQTHLIRSYSENVCGCCWSIIACNDSSSYNNCKEWSAKCVPVYYKSSRPTTRDWSYCTVSVFIYYFIIIFNIFDSWPGRKGFL